MRSRFLSNFGRMFGQDAKSQIVSGILMVILVITGIAAFGFLSGLGLILIIAAVVFLGNFSRLISSFVIATLVVILRPTLIEAYAMLNISPEHFEIFQYFLEMQKDTQQSVLIYIF